MSATMNMNLTAAILAAKNAMLDICGEHIAHYNVSDKDKEFYMNSSRMDVDYILSRFGWLAPQYLELARMADQKNLWVRFTQASNVDYPEVMVALPLDEATYYDRGRDQDYNIPVSIPLGYALKLAQANLILSKDKVVNMNTGHCWCPDLNWKRFSRQVAESFCPYAKDAIHDGTLFGSIWVNRLMDRHLAVVEAFGGICLMTGDEYYPVDLYSEKPQIGVKVNGEWYAPQCSIFFWEEEDGEVKQGNIC